MEKQPNPECRTCKGEGTYEHTLYGVRDSYAGRYEIVEEKCNSCFPEPKKVDHAHDRLMVEMRRRIAALNESRAVYV